MPNNIKTLFRPLILLCIFVVLPSLSAGDSIEYFYDDNGQLVRIVKGTEGITYQYDEVGNLLSITKSVISNSSPVLNSINPDVLFIGSTTLVAITGQNLFTTQEVTSTDPSLNIKIISVNDTEIRLEIAVSDGVSPGEAEISVTTSYGTASILTTLVLSSLIFTPGQLALSPGNSGTIMAELSPPIGKDISIIINNNNPSIVSAPQSVTVSSSGSASFSITAINKGIATISSGDPRTIIFVTDPFSSDEDIFSMTDAVSVVIESTGGSSSIPSLPVSVGIEAPPEDSSVLSFPVSVGIEVLTGDSSLPSLPVSVGFEVLTGNTFIASLPVSVYIQTLSDVSATADANPVSIYIQTQTGDVVTVTSLVSVGKCLNQPVKVIGAASGYYSSLQDAYNAASSGDIIKSHAGLLIEDLNINQDKAVMIEGGYDCDFTTVIGKTSLQGIMRVSSGTLKIGNLKLEE